MIKNVLVIVFVYCFVFRSSTNDSMKILKSIGLVKHPQVMSCIYITLFLLTMLIISQQVMNQANIIINYFLFWSLSPQLIPASLLRLTNWKHPDDMRPCLLCPHIASASQNEYCFRRDFLLKNKNRTEQDEIETRENLNRLLLENVLPAHVASLFVGENKKNEVRFFIFKAPY